MAVIPRASIEPAELAVGAGSTAVAGLRVRNEGSAEQRFRFEVLSDAALWVTVIPFAVTVEPGGEGTAQVLLKPPRSSSVEAGPHHVVVRVRAQDDRSGDLETTAAVEVEVQPFVEIAAALLSQAAGLTLSIDNRGNAKVRAVVTASERGSERPIPAEPALVELEPGTSVDVSLATAGRRPVFGSPRERTVEVLVAPEGGVPVTAAGAVRQKPLASRRVAVVAAIVVVVLVAALLRGVVFSSSTKSNANQIASTSNTCRGAGHLAHDANGQIRQNVVEPDNYSFLFLQPGGCLPVRWNPCQPIHYVINGSLASPAQIADTRQAAADIAQATGMDYVYDGTTTVNSQDFQPFAPAAFGARWAPVLIDWSHFGGADSLTEVAGGGVPDEFQGVYVSGSVFINIDAHLANNAPIPDGFGSGVTWGRILLHELGHVAGLGHVTGFDQIMHEPVTEQTSPTSAYGIGDLAGLRLLGKPAGCLTTPPVPASAG